MTREEAIEVYNGLINTKIKEAFEFFAPELREINDEEIRKDIIGGLMWQRDNLKSEGPHDNNLILPGFCLTVGKHLSYLEKQKEQKDYRKLYEDIAKSKWFKRAYDGKSLGCDDEQKEQKPNSTEDMPYITDERFYEREPADSFKYKLAEYMTKCCTKKEGPYGYTYGISAETILKMAKEELIKRGELKEQKPAEDKYQQELEATDRWQEGYEAGYNAASKPAEWSEEDENRLNAVIELLENTSAIHPNYSRRKLIIWLKSLRPCWKPSEEQIGALNYAYCELFKRKDVGHNILGPLQKLCDEFKKLM